MRPATSPRAGRSEARLLVLPAADPSAMPSPIDATASDLPRFLRPGDLLVLNDAATLPASLRGHTPSGEAIELRLLGAPLGFSERSSATAVSDDPIWPAVLFGAGDWRTPTEHRPLPPSLRPGDRLRFAPLAASIHDCADALLSAEVVHTDPAAPRLIEVRFAQRGAAFLAALYALGRPIQYSYLRQDLALWTVQTVYAARPWAAEMPSAGRPLSWEILLALRRRGVDLAWLTHAAGLSSTGDAALDRRLPLPERYDLPDLTVAAIDRTRRRHGRVIAVGTTVVRALEGAERSAQETGAARGTLRSGSGLTSLLLSETTQLAVVDGLLTGMHGPGESHFRLLSAFVAETQLQAAWQHATLHGYQCHEFGDLCLLFRRP